MPGSASSGKARAEHHKGRAYKSREVAEPPRRAEPPFPDRRDGFFLEVPAPQAGDKRAEKDAQSERHYLLTESRRNAERLSEAMKHHLAADAVAAAADLRAAVTHRVLEHTRRQLADGVDDTTQERMIRAFTQQIEEMDLND